MLHCLPKVIKTTKNTKRKYHISWVTVEGGGRPRWKVVTLSLFLTLPTPTWSTKMSSTHYTYHTKRFTLLTKHNTIDTAHLTFNTTLYTPHTTHYTLHIIYYTWVYILNTKFHGLPVWPISFEDRIPRVVESALGFFALGGLFHT